jgi:hypothetical protein
MLLPFSHVYRVSGYDFQVVLHQLGCVMLKSVAVIFWKVAGFDSEAGDLNRFRFGKGCGVNRMVGAADEDGRIV